MEAQAGSQPLLTPAQASKYLGVSKSTLAAWRMKQYGPQFIKLAEGSGGSVRYRMEDLLAYCDGKVERP